MSHKSLTVVGVCLAAVLAASGCAAGGQPPAASPASSASAPADANNPFGVVAGSTVDAVVFDGGYKTDYVDFAAGVMKQKMDVTATVAASANVGQELQPRFVSGNPPDLVDNTGAGSIPENTILSELLPMDDLWAAKNYDGDVIGDVVMAGVKETGTYDGKFVAVPYVMTLFSLWYSKSLLAENGWTVPKTWDEMLTLGEQAKAKGKYLFTFGKEASSYWQWALLDSATKEGGREVWLRVANLEPNAWSDPAIVGVLTKMKESVDKGYWVPGGAGTQFTQAQAQWSNDQSALFYMSGSWIESEMKMATKAGFEMTATPVPTLTTTPKLPFETVSASASERFIVPAKAANAAGGKELLRALLSKEAAANFSKTRMAPTIVKDTVPADGFGSTALASTMGTLEAAGDNIISFPGLFTDFYGMGDDGNVAWSSFLSGDLSVEQMTARLQEINDKVASDSSITKNTYK